MEKDGINMNRFKVAGLSLVFLGVIAVLISGCATTSPRNIVMGVDSIVARNVSSKGKVYVITSTMQNISDNDLEFQEVAGYVENALSSKGYVRKDNKENADLLICLNYGIGTPVKSYQSQTTHGMAMPIYGIWMSTPSRTQTIEITTYVATLVLEAYDLKNPNMKSQLWKTTTKLSVYSFDLRAVLPFMVAASADYFGINTGKNIVVSIQEDDPRVLNIRKQDVVNKALDDSAPRNALHRGTPYAVEDKSISNVDYSQKLVLGKTTKQDVQRDLGKPIESEMGSSSGKYEYWAYLYRKTSSNTALGQTGNVLHKLILEFDNKGILNDYREKVVQ